MPTIFRYVKDEQGIETLEWIAVGALIVAVALVVYPGTLQGGLQSVINTVVGKINTYPDNHVERPGRSRGDYQQ